MNIEKERKIFQALLWTFLVGVIILYIFYISSGRVSISSPLWLMLLLLDAGFILFTFIPLPGRRVSGPDTGDSKSRKWYPKTISDIVERNQEESQKEKQGTLEPASAIAPIPLIPLMIIFIIILISRQGGGDITRWQAGETERLQTIYEEVAGRLTGLEELARTAAAEADSIYSQSDPITLDQTARAVLINRIDSLATATGRVNEPFGEIGIQIFDKDGQRIAWGGVPRYTGRVNPRSDETRIFSSKTQLYTMLVYETPSSLNGRVIVDIPLEVDYRINNRFLRSTGLGAKLSEYYGEEVELNYWAGRNRAAAQWRDGGAAADGPLTIAEEKGNVRVYGMIESSLGYPLAQLSVNGETFEAVKGEKRQKRTFQAGVLLALCVILISRWSYRSFARKERSGFSRGAIVVKRIALLLFFITLIRYILLRLDIPSAFLGSNLFDPALFADDLPGGLMRTVGDFLITSVFLLILVFGSVKVFRTYFGGYLERKIGAARSFSFPRLVIKSVLAGLVIISAVQFSEFLVSRSVLNANPRLVGFDAEFYSLPVLSLHLSLLLSVSAIFVAVIFSFRVILVWGGGSAREGIPSVLAALVMLVLISHPHWSLFLAAAALAALSTRIFPMLRKEEALSLIFSSFFLVLICSLVVYGVAYGQYEELRKGRVLEKLQSFNYPEDNWLMIVLPDLCEEIFNSRQAVAKVLSRKESTAFEIWADSGLSRFGVSCVFDVYDSNRIRFSRFSVGMAHKVMEALPDEIKVRQLPDVYRISREMERGKVYFLVGSVPLYHLDGKSAGYVEIKIPYFFDDPEMLVSAGPMAPEIFQNVESGTLAPRIDEPEDLLVARLEGSRVTAASAPVLPEGTVFKAGPDEWFDLKTSGDIYSCIIGRKEDGTGFLAGFRKSGLKEKILQWAMIVSLDIILTIIALVVLLIIRKLPILGSVTPAVSFSAGLSFRRKLLLSFLAVSVMPVMLMGIFSGRYIRYRFGEEGDREAVSMAASAEAFIKHSIKAEAEAFAGSQYLGDILSGRRQPKIRDVSQFDGFQFTLFDDKGNLLLDESLSDFSSEEIHRLIIEGEAGRVSLASGYPYVSGGTVIPVDLPSGPGGYLYYMRRLDDRFMTKVAGVLGNNINLYVDGILRSSSEKELFTGGFLNTILSPDVFAEIGLGRTRISLQDQALGGYSYKVANISMPSFRSSDRGVLSVPLLYRTALVRKEILRSYALILGLLALLFSSAVTLGVFLAGKIIDPISALRGGTRRIIKGDLEFRLEADAQDEIGDLVNSFNTMTEALREARRDLLERQRYLSAILDNVATGVVSADSGGMIMTVNPSGERMLGLESGEITGKRPEEIENEQLSEFLHLFEHRDEEIGEKEITIFSGDKKRTLKTVVTSLFEGGERLGTVVVFDDLTELIRTKKLSAWVEMARQIAHEVKNPLTPIKLSVQLMRRAYREGSEEFDKIFEEGVDTVIQQTDILRSIASEFSSFGKAVNLSPEPIDVDDFINEILGGYRGASGIDLTYEPSGTLSVLADREALRKIFVNLVENAIDATAGSGEIKVFCLDRDGKVEIAVVDSGSGLPVEVEERLFEPYFSTKTNGTGLGLAISQSLAREMEGEIVLRNREDASGVKAVVRIPRSGGGK